MFYAKLKNNGLLDKYPYTLTDLRIENPNTSFPFSIDEEIAATFGVVPVQPTDRPEENYKINLERTAKKVENKWIELWISNPASEEEINQRTEAKSKDVREKRNSLLAESDWTQLADVELGEQKKHLWTEYRKYLRDITKQQGFPWDVSWPNKPE